MKCVRVDSEKDTGAERQRGRETERMGDRLIADSAKSKQRIQSLLMRIFYVF